MPSLASNLYTQCRNTLLRRLEFQSYQALCTVFTTDELSRTITEPTTIYK